MKRGYVKLWRKVTDSGLIQHPSALQVFVWLLVNVAWKPTKYATRYGVMDIQTGEVIVGRKKLATLLNSTEQKIRTALAMLSNMEIITIESTSEFSRITLRNWDKYQTEISSQPAEQPAANQQLTTVKEVKKKTPSIEGKAFTDYFYDKHLKAHNQKPSPAVWAFKKSQDLTSALGLKEVCRRCDNYFGDPYLKAHPLEDFIGAPDKWIAKREKLNLSKTDQQTAMDRKRTAL